MPVESCDPSVRLEIRVKNNRLYRKIHEAFGSMAQEARPSIHGVPPLLRIAAQAIGVDYGRLGALLGFRKPAYRKDGQPTAIAVTVARYFESPLHDLFPPELCSTSIKGIVVREVDGPEFVPLTKAANLAIEANSSEETRARQDAAIDAALLTLPPRVQQVIRFRFGIGAPQETLAEIGKRLSVSRERVREIESQGLRMLRHPARSAALAATALSEP